MCYAHFIDEETNKCLSNLARITKPESDGYLNPRKLESGTCPFYTMLTCLLELIRMACVGEIPFYRMALVNQGYSSWSLTCCIFKGLLTWEVERGASSPATLKSLSSATLEEFTIPSPVLASWALGKLKVASYEQARSLRGCKVSSTCSSN